MDNIIIDPGWKRIVAKIKNNPALKTIYLIGACDTGKSTFAHFLVKSLCETDITGYLDCDPGQSVLGTPATLSLGIYNQTPDPEAFAIGTPAARYLRFVGSHTPVGHMLENVTCIRKLLDKAYQGGAAKVVIDSCGYIQDAVARSFQFHALDITSPDLIIELYQEYTLQSLLLNFTGAAEIIRLTVLPVVKQKSPELRKANREDKFRHYFANHKHVIIDYSAVGLHGRIPDFRNRAAYHDRLIALCNRNQFVLVLGLIKDADLIFKRLTIAAPPFPAERVTSIHFGSLFCALNGEHRIK